MSRHVDFLPLGSVVQVKDVENEYFIVCQRCVHTKPAGNKDYQLFDYGCARYPYGIYDHDLYYFNTKDIYKVIFKGYSDDEDKKIVESINEYLSKNDYSFSFWDKVSTFWESRI